MRGDADGNTALIWAATCSENDPTIIGALVAAGADPNAANSGGITALMSAARFDDVDAAKALLDVGADIERRDKRGRTALMIAVMRGSIDTARLLVQRGANVNVRDEDDQSALAHAREALKDDQRTRMMALLTKAGAK